MLIKKLMRLDDHGVKYVDARELAGVLNYRWQKMVDIMENASLRCKEMNIDYTREFRKFYYLTSVGINRAKRPIVNYKISPFGLSLIALELASKSQVVRHFQMEVIQYSARAMHEDLQQYALHPKEA